jgi:hypothetical protein
MSKAMENLKREMLEKHRLWAIANPEEHAAETKRLAKGLEDIPEKQMFDQLQYITGELLPAVKKKGKASDVEFFESLARSLAYAAIIIERYDYLYGRFINSRIDVALLRDRLEMMEKELQRYTTMEDLYLSDFVDKYAAAVSERIKKDILRLKK